MDLVAPVAAARAATAAPVGWKAAGYLLHQCQSQVAVAWAVVGWMPHARSQQRSAGCSLSSATAWWTALDGSHGGFSSMF